MKLLPFQPTNDLEMVIVEAQRGARTIQSLLMDLAASPLSVSSKREVQANGDGFDPLLLEKDGQPLVAVFSSPDRASLHRAVASFVLEMNGRQFLLRLPPTYGVIVNPGYETQLVIAPEAVSELKKALTAK